MHAKVEMVQRRPPPPHRHTSQLPKCLKVFASAGLAIVGWRSQQADDSSFVGLQGPSVSNALLVRSRPSQFNVVRKGWASRRIGDSRSDEEDREESWYGADVDVAQPPPLTSDAVRLRSQEGAPEEDRNRHLRRGNPFDIDAITAMVKEELQKDALQPKAISVEEEVQEDLNLEQRLLKCRHFDQVLGLTHSASESRPLELREIATAHQMLGRTWSLKSELDAGDPRVRSLTDQLQTHLRSNDAVFEPEDITALMRTAANPVGAELRVQEYIGPLSSALLEVVPNMLATQLAYSLISVERLVEFGELEASIPVLLDDLAEKAEALRPQEITGVIDSASRLDLRDSEAKALDPILANLKTEDVKGLKIQDLAKLAWGISELLTDLKGDYGSLLAEIAKSVGEWAPFSKGKDAVEYLPTVMCAYAKIGFRDAFMRDAIADRFMTGNCGKKLDKWATCALAFSLDDDDDGIIHNGKKSSDFFQTFYRR
eukprot:TRINITY_DN15039_c0_g1_i4.p1 TRINITY_DN15039_c0_g1~~TRINITY_DN15039_c0_g1_i4.p1  ORF type:complete len:485 (+),score=97.60 TRINITY_DN15039_c0_g1_i4:63-1517(+)